MLTEAAQQVLVACLRQQSDATLDELRVWLAAAAPPVREPGYARAGGAAAGLAAQKKHLHAAERDTARVRGQRAAFVEAVHGLDYKRFHFVDETSTNLTYCRRYGRTPGGQRVGQAVPLHSGPNVTLIAALTPRGLGAAMTVSGAVNGDVFAAYLEQVLGPLLTAG